RESFITWSIKNYDGSRDDAVEFYQIAILIFYDNIQLGKLTVLNSSIKSYLFAIGKNKWREYFRHKSRFSSEGLIDLMTRLTEEREDEETASDILILKKELESLGSPCRELLEAFYYEGLSLEEIVVRFGYKNKDAAKTAKYKCLQRLKRHAKRQ
ncbi:MAG: sigma-70 family RNA polymerase sigma factor, partial [Saprospiraceae bacterium]|nr:sigma-70 family RNA polymerase sigma factor [Saprospiraceae bacterium]